MAIGEIEQMLGCKLQRQAALVAISAGFGSALAMMGQKPFITVDPIRFFRAPVTQDFLCEFSLGKIYDEIGFDEIGFDDFSQSGTGTAPLDT